MPVSNQRSTFPSHYKNVHSGVHSGGRQTLCRGLNTFKKSCFSSHFAGVFNYFVNFGISITFPLFISIGISLGLPVNAVADSIFRGDEFGVLKVVSLLLILAGFLMMLIPSEKLRRFEPCSSNEVTKVDETVAAVSIG